jgi:hypothetical protein
MSAQVHTGLKAADHEIYLRYFDEGEKFDRAFRISVLPPNAENPMTKVALGCYEIPKDPATRGPWFYPVKLRIDGDGMNSLLDMLHSQAALYVAMRKTHGRNETAFLVKNLLWETLDPCMVAGRADRMFGQITFHSGGL